ncbi:MAG: hypothetical protein ACO3FI_09910 [Cyclobacteriaceae bacterium]
MTIQEINNANTRVADKWYRMFHNFGSELIAIDGNTLIIEVNLSLARGWTKSNEQTARQIATDYAHHFNDGFKPSGYRVSIIQNRPTKPYGFLTDLKQATDQATLKDLLNEFKSSPIKPDNATEEIEIYEGTY